jgi:8-oxo-dGTP pyrophosphatase MutT (NUDIX family)
MSNNHKKKIYCCNCGKLGHILKTCLEPIISLGIVLYCVDNDNNIKFLLIRRKFSLGFMDFVMGKYCIDNLDYIKRIFNEMTIEEKVRILNESFDSLWYSIDYNCLDVQNATVDENLRKKIKSDYNVAKRKFNMIKGGFINKSQQYINLYDVIYNCQNNWLEPEWEFPKGKRKMNESNLDAAIREFSEETNFPISDMEVIIGDTSFVEKYYGSNGKKYKHIYYIARAKNMLDYTKLKLTHQQEVEISDIRWMSYTDSMKNIRPYQIERKMVLNQIVQYLVNNKLY